MKKTVVTIAMLFALLLHGTASAKFQSQTDAFLEQSAEKTLKARGVDVKEVKILNTDAKITKRVLWIKYATPRIHKDTWTDSEFILLISFSSIAAKLNADYNAQIDHTYLAAEDEKEMPIANFIIPVDAVMAYLDNGDSEAFFKKWLGNYYATPLRPDIKIYALPDLTGSIKRDRYETIFFEVKAARKPKRFFKPKVPKYTDEEIEHEVRTRLKEWVPQTGLVQLWNTNGNISKRILKTEHIKLKEGGVSILLSTYRTANLIYDVNTHEFEATIDHAWITVLNQSGDRVADIIIPAEATNEYRARIEKDQDRNDAKYRAKWLIRIHNRTYFYSFELDKIPPFNAKKDRQFAEIALELGNEMKRNPRNHDDPYREKENKTQAFFKSLINQKKLSVLEEGTDNPVVLVGPQYFTLSEKQKTELFESIYSRFVDLQHFELEKIIIYDPFTQARIGAYAKSKLITGSKPGKYTDVVEKTRTFFSKIIDNNTLSAIELETDNPVVFIGPSYSSLSERKKNRLFKSIYSALDNSRRFWFGEIIIIDPFTQTRIGIFNDEGFRPDK